MKILIASSEVAPFSKTGGLADVAGVLPLALKEASGCDARVISPFYKMVKEGGFKIKKIKELNCMSQFGSTAPFELLEAELKGAKFYFIGKDEYFDREGLYGTPQGDYPDNAERFSFFCRAALTAMIDIEFYPDIIHANDWQTALLPLYKNANLEENHPLRKSKTLFSIHNLAYQGIFERDIIKRIGVSEKSSEPLARYGKISFIKSGIFYSDAISTVSKKYAEEILTPECGCAMDDMLRKREKNLYGILNGADYSNWNPETDKLIPENYNIQTLEKKMTCKIELIKFLNLKLSAQAPLIGSVGRLSEQKGVDLMIEAIDEIIKSGAGFVLLGAGDGKYESALKRIAAERRKGISISIAFDNKLAHMIEAGVDIFAMPSRYEPCGLNQMYSLKYGTIPVVRATGGLDDTIIDYSVDQNAGNGFKFEKAETGDFVRAIKRAIKVFHNRKEWIKLQKRVMTSDFSWKHAAREYIALYEKMLKKNSN